ncbi:MAG TPA: alpha/beta fold hydrolase [Casimicrobiaceae bacterium]|nr:alpha/beta fold hydrolase [Casimicrobiaceae bacterium]
MHKLSARLLLAIILAWFLAPHAMAQPSPASPPSASDQSTSIPASLYLLAVTARDGNGKAVAGADVALDETVVGVTDDSGQYYLARKPLPPGTHTLSVSRAGYTKFTRDVRLPAGGDPGIMVAVTLKREPSKLLARGVAPTDRTRGVAYASTPNYNVVRIFYVTDRKDTGNANPVLRFANERAAGGTISRGTCDVSIPRTHESGNLESPSWVRLEYRPDPNKHVVLLNVNSLTPDPFYTQLSERLAQSKDREVVVFIHGFNNSFEEAARKMAQLTWDLQFDGAPILYSWPSRNRLLAYTQDEDTVQWTAFHLRAFLEELAARTDAKKIHLIAHSMGNRALTSALQVIAAKRQNAPRPLFDQVVLAAPDIGAQTMELLANEVRPIASRMTLYASDNDDALLLSKFVHGGTRAGGKDNFLLVAPGIDTIDASAVRTDFLGHAYFDNSVHIISDIRKMISTAASPEARSLIPGFIHDLRYWIMPANSPADVQVR